MSGDFGLGDVLVSMFWFMLLVVWIWMIIAIFGDIFRDHELGGGAKALWTLFIIIIPWLGALVYLIVRGRSMNERALKAAQAHDEQMKAYVRDAAGTSTSTADELRKLNELRSEGVLSEEDYEKAKAKTLG
ncbi:SHOCT domain-containing protein [Nocardioides panacis]|uniref:SHOCT domain-containing protein n=2 Tax=Nocardioides panacis TaxID=2849501 RepID=A0A975Y0T4_9ACTN|nr:SHOCT domain-containing protein [Nocardioides panacis]